SERVLQMIRERIRFRANRIWERLGAPGEVETPAEEYRRLRLQTLQVERDEILKIRATGTVDHDVIEQVLASLDIEESMLTMATERSEQVADADAPVEAPPSPVGDCVHLTTAGTEVGYAPMRVCQDCIREGTRPVHLRLCLSCGNVGCCDSSVGRHADRHFHQSKHPVIRSFEPNESWRWCYVDERIG
ncbi:MAG: monovalent cation/hydrogen antiporter, partial [Propionibacteriaceae bacterium]|nr:monovalent cation/hydrogen antiporter [Propionibacteriaceae bacterium]